MKEETEEKSGVRPRIPALFMLFLLLAGGIASVPTVIRIAPYLREEVGEQKIIAGGWSESFEEQFGQAVPLQEVSRSIWGAIRYLVFNEGSSGVLVGADDWLFTTEEYEVSPEYMRNILRNVDFIARVKDRLEKKGIRLIVALIPAKARVYPDAAPHALPEAAQSRYTDFRNRLLELNIPAPDILSSLQDAKTGAPVYLRTDTHWTPAGARAAAAAISSHMENASPPIEVQKSSFALETGEKIQIRGDLVSFLGLGLFERVGPDEETIRPYSAKPDASASLDLFGDPVIPVAVVGTSYSADSRWSFVEALKIELQSDVLSVATEGEGPFAPMSEYLESETIVDVPPQLVVWEIPARYVTLDWEITG